MIGYHYISLGIQKKAGAGKSFRGYLRDRTDQTEVLLCGHATMATAHILWEQHYEPEERFRWRKNIHDTTVLGGGIQVRISIPAVLRTHTRLTS